MIKKVFLAIVKVFKEDPINFILSLAMLEFIAYLILILVIFAFI